MAEPLKNRVGRDFVLGLSRSLTQFFAQGQGAGGAGSGGLEAGSKEGDCRRDAVAEANSLAATGKNASGLLPPGGSGTARFQPAVSQSAKSRPSDSMSSGSQPSGSQSCDPHSPRTKAPEAVASGRSVTDKAATKHDFSTAEHPEKPGKFITCSKSGASESTQIGADGTFDAGTSDAEVFGPGGFDAKAFNSKDFDAEAFTDFLLGDDWENREIMDRLHRIAEAFHRFLPGPVPARLNALLAVHQQHTGIAHLAFPAYVEDYALSHDSDKGFGQNQETDHDHWEESLAALEAFTPVSSAEFAVRPFIRADQQRMMARMEHWAQHSNEHLRRLASEGCRPRLPWSSPLRRFIADPAPVLPVLHALKNDPSEYVRRSVANNLNDISKDHPDLVLDICEEWHGASKDTDRLIKHALRTLLKAGDLRALALHGFGDPKGVRIHKLTMRPARVSIGDRAEFSFGLSVPKGAARNLRLEYVVHFTKKNGSLSPKVFQLREARFTPGKHEFAKGHAFADLTTRKHHPGKHVLAIHVNGRELARTEFTLS